MNLIDEQITKLSPLESVPNCKILVIIDGTPSQETLNSLGDQLYTNFDVICIDQSVDVYLERKFKIGELLKENKIDKIQNILQENEAGYIYILDRRDILPPHALLKYAIAIEQNNFPGIAYANEAFQSGHTYRHLEYMVKPAPSNISFFQSCFIGVAIIWEKSLLQKIINAARQNDIDSIHQELFILALLHKPQIIKLNQFLLIRTTKRKTINIDNHMLTIFRKNISLNTNWEGHIDLTSSYGINCFELYVKQTDLLNQCGFIIIEDDLDRTLQLLSQLSISCSKNEIIIGVWENDKSSITEYCFLHGLSNVTIITRNRTYTDTLINVIPNITSQYHIILNDLVQWVNRMNLERLVKSFLKPEVMIAVPQVATEGEHPTLVYAGAGINNLSLNGSYFSGRAQEARDHSDLAWINYAVSMLTHYCIAIRRETWNAILPLHFSVITARHLANELSFLCMRKGLLCEYCAQSSVWVKKEVGNYNQNGSLMNGESLTNIDIEPQMSGNYWHLLLDYGDLISTRKYDIPYLIRSFSTHLKEDFCVFGLDKIKESKEKRVLVLTHELSLTGAPLVLVQAVKALLQFGYSVLVASPTDGPLRKTYLQMEIPVIIDPQLQYNFNYIKIGYDFNFVFVSTVVLWQCIEELGKTSIPVFWWIHDSRIGYENNLRYILPKMIGENISLYCGGSYAQNVIKEFRPLYKSKLLLYGVEDFSLQISTTVDRSYWNLPKDKYVFANIGQICKRKGQDILCKAIYQLPNAVRDKCVFVFVGSIIDRNIYSNIMKLKKIYPENIVYIKEMPYDLLKEFYREIDGVICSSVDDPLPAFVTEALMMTKICVCSKNTAFNSLIVPKKSGYLFESGNIDELTEIIKYIIENPDVQHEIGKEARKLYENSFSPQIFIENFSKAVNEVTSLQTS